MERILNQDKDKNDEEDDSETHSERSKDSGDVIQNVNLGKLMGVEKPAVISESIADKLKRKTQVSITSGSQFTRRFIL